jgi:hypothetical protein
MAPVALKVAMATPPPIISERRTGSGEFTSLLVNALFLRVKLSFSIKEYERPDSSQILRELS